MKLFFWITFYIFLMIYLYKIIFKKNIFHYSTYIILGVYLPLVLYFRRWSDLIFSAIASEFYAIFIYLNISLSILVLVSKKHNKIVNDKSTLKYRKTFIILSFFYIMLYFVENYLGSGTFIPALRKIDIHTYSAPVISFITRSPFIFVSGNLLFYLKYKTKVNLWTLIIILIQPMITRGARMNSLITAFQIVSFLIFYIINNKSTNLTNSKKNRVTRINTQKVILVSLVSFGILVWGMGIYTNYRMNHFGKYDLTYSNSIQYTGPKLFSNIFSTYYGYFPLSFNNLNLNIQFHQQKYNYIGLYTFKFFYFGLLQLDNIFGLDPYTPYINKLVTTGAATVPTGFYDFYYDFGYFSFVPIVVGLIICGFLFNKMQKENTMLWKMNYFFYAPLWFFMSFQNSIFGSTVFVSIILIALFNSIFISRT